MRNPLGRAPSALYQTNTSAHIHVTQPTNLCYTVAHMIRSSQWSVFCPMKKLTLRELKQYLKNKSHDDLVNDIATLFTRFDAVKEYYTMHLGGTHSPHLLDQYKSVIRQEFFPARGYGDARLSVARKAVNDYKKVSDSREGLVDLMLFYVEMGVKYTNQYGDINESFYSSMERMYEQATKYIADYILQDQFQERRLRIVSDTSGIGWGFHDTLNEIYDEIFAT